MGGSMKKIRIEVVVEEVFGIFYYILFFIKLEEVEFFVFVVQSIIFLFDFFYVIVIFVC